MVAAQNDQFAVLGAEEDFHQLESTSSERDDLALIRIANVSFEDVRLIGNALLSVPLHMGHFILVFIGFGVLGYSEHPQFVLFWVVLKNRVCIVDREDLRARLEGEEAEFDERGVVILTDSSIGE